MQGPSLGIRKKFEYTPLGGGGGGVWTAGTIFATMLLNS